MRLRDLRAHAVAGSLSPSSSLQAALDRAGFVQADPIRAPACAQDLILRHRAPGYRAGDLERAYPSLRVEEGFLYAYGFLARALWPLAHPPRAKGLSALERRVLEAVRARGPTHPRDLEAELGRSRRVNAWGGWSKATTIALERLHRRGLLRVRRREAGVRVYEAQDAAGAPADPAAALRALVLTAAAVLAPARARTVRAVAASLGRRVEGAPGARARRARRADVLRELEREGALRRETVEGVEYLLPPAPVADPPREVRLLAPFDPVVWDRGRFEHLWGWTYRFEAYTPVAKRVRGYYALPLLWVDQVVGWANARVDDAGRLDVDLGFVRARPRGAEFRRALEAELGRLEAFLALGRAAMAAPTDPRSAAAPPP